MTPADKYNSLCQYYAEKQGLPWQMVRAQMLAESAGNPHAMSPVGAQGLMQAMPGTWAEWMPKGDPFNPEHAIDFGTKYMRWLLDQCEQNYDLALACYNYGIGNMRRVQKEHGDKWAEHLPRETRAYLARIKRLAATTET